MDIKKKQEQLKNFAKSLKELSVQELEAKEQEIIARADENDKKVAETKFKMPKDNYKIVASGIQTLLNKKTVEWQYTLGLLSMYEFWDPNKYQKEIAYPMLDATLRTLGEMQFTGYEEWAMVVAINKYFEILHPEYEKVTESIYDLANEHNAVMDELALRIPKKEEAEQVNS